MPTQTVKIAKLHPDAIIPAPQSAGAACFDLHAVIDGDELSIPPGKAVSVRTGLAVEVPVGYRLDILGRSGHWFKSRARLGNSIGKVDADFRGELLVSIENASDSTFTIKPGDRIAQGELNVVTQTLFEEVPYEELSKTERGTGGFGSTGISK